MPVPDRPESSVWAGPRGRSWPPWGCGRAAARGATSGDASAPSCPAAVLRGQGPEGTMRSTCKHSRASGTEVAWRRVSEVRSCHGAHVLQVPSSHRLRHPHLRAGTSGRSPGRLRPPVSSSPHVRQLPWCPAVTGLFLNHKVLEAAPLGWLLGGGGTRGGVGGHSHAGAGAPGQD